LLFQRLTTSHNVQFTFAYQRKVSLCGIRIFHISYEKNVESPAWIDPIGQRPLPDLSKKRATGRAKKTGQPPFSLSLVPPQIRPLPIGYLICHSKWQLTCAILIGSSACQSLLSRPVTVRLRETRRRVFHSQSFYLFLCFQLEKKKNHRGIFLWGTTNVSHPIKTEPWTILLYVLKSPT